MSEDRNEAVLAGRVAADPEERVLPSGDRVWTLRLVVRRPEGSGRQSVDTLDCCAWSPRVQRTVRGWRAGDQVAVEGAVRRRFYRAGGAGSVSRVEIELAAGRLIRRADGG